MKQPGKAVLWPANIDSSRTSKQGRKIHRSLCVNSPRLQEMETAARTLELGFEIIKGSSRPNSWWDRPGSIVVEKSGMSKRALLSDIAREIRNLRAKSQEK